MVRKKKIESLLSMGIGILLILILNQLAGIFPMRLDLTEERRYSVNPATRALPNFYIYRFLQAV